MYKHREVMIMAAETKVTLKTFFKHTYFDSFTKRC